MSEVNTTPASVDNTDEAQGAKWVCHLILTEGVIGVFGNLLVCFVILRVKFLHNMTNFLLVNLAVADMLSCVQSFFFHLFVGDNCKLISYLPRSTEEGELLCRLLASMFAGWTLSYVTSYSLCLVTLERYVAIVHPLHYGRKLTTKRISCLIGLIWVMAILMSLPLLFIRGPSTDPLRACSDIDYPHESFPVLFSIFGVLLAFLVPITFMCWAYYKIQMTLKRQAQALHIRQVKVAAYDLVLARQRLVNMLMIVLGGLIIFWTPAYVVALMCLHPSNESTLSICGSSGFQYIRAITNFLFYMNSVINPVIFEFKYKKFQRGLKTALWGCFQKQSNNRVGVATVQY